MSQAKKIVNSSMSPIELTIKRIVTPPPFSLDKEEPFPSQFDEKLFDSDREDDKEGKKNLIMELYSQKIINKDQEKEISMSKEPTEINSKSKESTEKNEISKINDVKQAIKRNAKKVSAMLLPTNLTTKDVKSNIREESEPPRQSKSPYKIASEKNDTLILSSNSQNSSNKDINAKKSNSKEKNDIYFVDRILDKKRRNGKTFYLIKWEGYGPEQNSWEPLENLNGIKELIEKFNKKLMLIKAKQTSTLRETEEKGLNQEEKEAEHDKDNAKERENINTRSKKIDAVEARSSSRTRNTLPEPVNENKGKKKYRLLRELSNEVTVPTQLKRQRNIKGTEKILSFSKNAKPPLDENNESTTKKPILAKLSNISLKVDESIQIDQEIQTEKDIQVEDTDSFLASVNFKINQAKIPNFGDFRVGDEINLIKKIKYNPKLRLVYAIVEWKKRENGVMPLDSSMNIEMMKKYAPTETVDFLIDYLLSVNSEKS